MTAIREPEKFAVFTWWMLLFALVASSSPGAFASEPVSAQQGESIARLIERVREDGHDIVYSSSLVSRDLTIQRDRSDVDLLELLRVVLSDKGLKLDTVDGLHVVARQKAEEKRKRVLDRSIERASFTRPILPEIIATASKYELLRREVSSRSEFTLREIEVVPTLGDDPIRAIHRLPGVASGGLSAKPHIRGSEANDLAVILNGQRLLDPFHIRDYQSLFSAIDTRAIDRLEVYTGGFPASYGDRMGGIVVIDSRRPEERLHTELGVSVYNTSILNKGQVADGDIEWLFSARRGNLDQIIDRKYGKPSYHDVFSEISVNFSERSRLSVNGLLAEDDILLVAENAQDELEMSQSSVSNIQLWATLLNRWTDDLTSSTTLSTASFDSARAARIEDIEYAVGSVEDLRQLQVLGLQQSWNYRAFDDHDLTIGFSAAHQNAEYDYRSVVEFQAQQVLPTPVGEELRNRVLEDFSGNSYSLFLTDSWRLNDQTIAELGIRWDRQTYTTSSPDTQFSPRLGIIHEVNSRVLLRASVGRYYQSQGIHELQVEDGVDQFFPAQRADHAILGANLRLTDFLSARIEGYYKWYDRVRPRYENILDPLAVIPELEPDRTRIAPDSARAVGLETALTYEGPRNLSWWASYTLSNAEDRFPSGYIPRSWDQRHAIQLGMTWTADTWDIGVALNAHSGWPTTDIYTDFISPVSNEISVGDRNGARFGDYATLDFRVGYKKPLGDNVLHLFFEVSNATNRQNLCCADFDIETNDLGQRFVEKEYDYWLPLLPAVGFLYEF